MGGVQVGGERVKARVEGVSHRYIADSRRVDERSERVVTEGDRTEEVVVERRPVIEEVVVRRRVVDSDQVDDV